MRSEWDTPTLAMAEAIDELTGGEVSMIMLKQAWQFYVGHGDHSFTKALERALVLWPENIKPIYRRNPGFYTEVCFELSGSIRPKDK